MGPLTVSASKNTEFWVTNPLFFLKIAFSSGAPFTKISPTVVRKGRVRLGGDQNVTRRVRSQMALRRTVRAEIIAPGKAYTCRVASSGQDVQQGCLSRTRGALPLRHLSSRESHFFALTSETSADPSAHEGRTVHRQRTMTAMRVLDGACAETPCRIVFDR